MTTETHPFPFPSSYPLTRLGKAETLLFFDIETTGFCAERSRVYLIGAIFLNRGTWELIQWFSEAPCEEAEILNAFFDVLRRFDTVIHFNGERFDIPFLLKRCQAHGLPYDFSHTASIDLYRRLKPHRGCLGLESLKQKSLEHFLGIHRQDPYSGGELIRIYRDYLLGRDASLRAMLLLHNREDLEGMARILPVLSYPDFLTGSFSLLEEETVEKTTGFGEARHFLRLVMESPIRLPVPISWKTPLAFCRAWEAMLELTVELREGTLKYFYPNCQDYYYLIYEDIAVHKSVGEYVEKQARRQATPRTCFTKQTGLFLLQPKDLFSPAFQNDDRDRQRYAKYLPGLFSEPEALLAYVRFLLDTGN